MKLVITKIEDVGNLEKERVIFSVSADVDVGKYLVLKSKKIGDSVSNRPSLVFWFEDKEIKKNDLVILYSKVGVSKSATNEKGNASHFFYWNQNASIWNENEAAVLISVEEWDFKFPKLNA